MTFKNFLCKAIVTINDKERFYVMEEKYNELNLHILLYESDVESVPLIKDMEYDIVMDPASINDEGLLKESFSKILFNDTFIDMFTEDCGNNYKTYGYGKVTVDYSYSLSKRNPIKELIILPMTK